MLGEKGGLKVERYSENHCLKRNALKKALEKGTVSRWTRNDEGLVEGASFKTDV